MSVPEKPPLRILVVDDDDLDREAVRRALSSRADIAPIAEASSIAEAEVILGAMEIDCVILDYLLPEGPCSTFLPRLKERARSAAFIVLTGQGDEQVAVDLMKGGIADYLSKDGLDPARLRRAARYAVSLRQAELGAAAAHAEQERDTDRLKRIVEGAPGLVGARTLHDLVSATSALTAEVLAAREVFVSLSHLDGSIESGHGGTGDRELATWARSGPPSIGATDARLSGDRLMALLKSRDGAQRGFIAVQLGTDKARSSEAHVLDQIGVLVAVCADNILLYESAARAIHARDEVLAVVSHDLRTPLNNVRLGANLLRESAGPEVETLVDRIDRSVAHMMRLVEDLLDMVRVEGGNIDLRIARESVADLLLAARQMLAAQAEAQRIALVCAPVPASLAVLCDRHRALQILTNLLGNALKFTPEGGSVTVSAREAGARVEIEVSDTGKGISEADAQNVFVRFFRSDRRGRRGLGLGLYIARGLVAAHGGKMWFESRPGEGSRFFFTLPRAVPGSEGPDAPRTEENTK